MKIRDIFCCWDFTISIILFMISIILLPASVSNTLSKEIYTVAIMVLSITFPVFFTALAIIITSSDDQFAIFLEKGGYYERILCLFKYSLFVIFIALVTSIILSIWTSYLVGLELPHQNKWVIGLFGFLFVYSLLVNLNAILTAITYANYRIRYLKITESKSSYD